MSNQPTLMNHLYDPLRTKVGIDLPNYTTDADYNLWAQILLEEDEWSARQKLIGLDSVSSDERLFIHFFIQTLRLLCELGRLPVFDLPRVASLSRDSKNLKRLTLEIELFLVHFLPHAAYLIPIKASLELCQWMVQNSPTTENKSKVFNTIIEKVIKPLHRIVPAGKSTIPVLRVAHELGIPFTHLGLGIYQLGWGSNARRLDRSTCELDSAIGSKLAQNKVSTANILRLAGLPAPTHGVVTKESDAIIIATKIGFPVVIKPTDCERGEGVTVDILDEVAVKTAFARAQKLSKSKQVIIERQVSGICHRLFVASGKLLYAVKRNPMSVIGDGKRTIRQLVDDEVFKESSKLPWSRSEIKPIDELALQTLNKLGSSPESIPSKCMKIPLRPIESTKWGGVDVDVTQIIHSENLSAALQAAKIFGLEIAGIDIISLDISKPWYTNGAIINEVNFAPLFGGGEISRFYIPKFFSQFVKDDGKIPIEFFDDESAAAAFQKEQLINGKSCFVTTSIRTIDPFRNEIVMPFSDLKKRIQALILRSDVDAIAVVNKDNTF